MEEAEETEEGTPMWVPTAELIFVVVLSLCFEAARVRLESHIREGGALSKSLLQVLDHLSQEVMTLGLVGLVVFVATKTEVALMVAEKIWSAEYLAEFRGAANPLTETFESVHMSIFFIIVSFILQCTLSLLMAYRETRKWADWADIRVRRSRHMVPDDGDHETALKRAATSTSSFVGAPLATKMTLEGLMVERGYIDQNGKAVRDLKLHANPIWEFLVGCPLRSMLQWRAIRHEFMFPTKKRGVESLEERVYRPQEPQFFDFAVYLSRKQGDVLVDILCMNKFAWGLLFLAGSSPLLLGGITPSSLVRGSAIVGCFLSLALVMLGVHTTAIYNRCVPKIPLNPEKCLSTFEGTSATAMLRRHRRHTDMVKIKSQGAADVADDGNPHLFDDMFRQVSQERLARSLSRRRPWHLRVLSAVSLVKLKKQGPTSHDLKFTFQEAAPDVYRLLVQLLTFWESMNVAGLLQVLCFTHVRWDLFQFILFAVGFACPLLDAMLVTPKILGRLTVLVSIESKKDRQCIEQVTFKKKVDMIVDAMCLMILASWEREEAATLLPRIALLGTDKFNAQLQQFREEKTRKRMVELFEFFDTDHSGSISPDEYVQTVAGSDETCLDSNSRASRLWEVFDLDLSHELDFHEFEALLALTAMKEDEESFKASMEDLFRKCDQDSSGTISIDEFAAFVENLGVPASTEDIASLALLVFQRVKQVLTMEEFVFFLDGISAMSLNG